jgi:uncharacterized coiled-coil protein SlyX
MESMEDINSESNGESGELSSLGEIINWNDASYANRLLRVIVYKGHKSKGVQIKEFEYPMESQDYWYFEQIYSNFYTFTGDYDNVEYTVSLHGMLGYDLYFNATQFMIFNTLLGITGIKTLGINHIDEKVAEIRNAFNLVLESNVTMCEEHEEQKQVITKINNYILDLMGKFNDQHDTMKELQNKVVKQGNKIARFESIVAEQEEKIEELEQKLSKQGEEIKVLKEKMIEIMKK